MLFRSLYSSRLAAKFSFRGAVYHIHVHNSAKSQKGIKTLLVNGTPVEGNMIPYQKDVTEYHVTAIM